jgi:hypothetical protein
LNIIINNNNNWFLAVSGLRWSPLTIAETENCLSHGKWPKQRQCLSKCVKCTRGLFGRYWRYLFGMPSKPQAFPNFKDCISFETSQGQKLMGTSSLTVASRALTWAPHVVCGHSHTNCMLWTIFSKQSAFMLALSVGKIMGLKEPWIADGIQLALLYSLCMDPTENTTSNGSPIVACIIITVVMCFLLAAA